MSQRKHPKYEYLTSRWGGMKLREEFEQIKNNNENQNMNFTGVVTKKDVCDVISIMTGIPIEELDEDEEDEIDNVAGADLH